MGNGTALSSNPLTSTPTFCALRQSLIWFYPLVLSEVEILKDGQTYRQTDRQRADTVTRIQEMIQGMRER
jgi:hypothetical protein